MIAALFVAKGGTYFGLPNVDPWDEARDARLYAGPWPVVAHPPCARWCRLAAMVEKLHGKKRGDDGGCFESALAAVRQWGGVLEHPAHTLAWAAFGLPAPRDHHWTRTFDGGFVVQVDQNHYGHPARKTTWLYAKGVDLPSMRSGPLSVTGCVSTSRRVYGSLPEIPKRLRSATPVLFRDLLIAMAVSALPLQPHADPAGTRAGGPEAGGQRPEDAPLELGPDHQRRG